MKNDIKKIESITVPQEINFKKAQYETSKMSKTQRIKKQEFARKQRNRKIALTIEVLIISIIIYALTGPLGELAQENKFYLLMTVLSWIWLFFVQFGVLFAIWCDDNEK